MRLAESSRSQRRLPPPLAHAVGVCLTTARVRGGRPTTKGARGGWCCCSAVRGLCGCQGGKGRGKGGRPRAVRSAHPRSSSRRFGLLLLPWHGHCSHCEPVGAPVAYSQPHMRLSRRLTLVRSVAVGSNDAGEGGPREGSTCVGRLTYPARFGDRVARRGRECGARTVSVSLASRPSRPGSPLGPPGRRGACRRKGEGCVRKGSSQRMSWRLPARALARGARMAAGGKGRVVTHRVAKVGPPARLSAARCWW